MKKYLLSFSIVISISAFSQCPKSGLKIQSPLCEEPKNLVVKTITCTEIKVQWSGSQHQTYVVTATCTNPITNAVSDAEVSPVSCKGDGNCTATIAVKDVSNVKWSVSAVCKLEGSTVYSSSVTGKEVSVPVCKKESNSSTQAFHIYPNPSSGDIAVEFENYIPQNAELKIYDVNGKKVYSTSASEFKNAGSSYKIDLHHLPDGVYLLEVSDGKNKSTGKFELLKK